MTGWPDTRLQKLLKVQHPVIQAPMAGSDSVALAAAVARAGGLGSLACALLAPEAMRDNVRAFRRQVKAPINLNFFCHAMPEVAASAEERWRAVLAPHYVKLGIDISKVPPGKLRLPFDEAACMAALEIKPEIVSFHFGLPAPPLLARLKSLGIVILASATSVAEAKWLEERGCDAVIAQGAEAGGHRGMFLETDIATQTGTMALVPQVADAVRVPVIAAGGIADARGIVAAFALGAAGVQLGTAYLFCPEANVSPLTREALAKAADNGTVLTNLFSGRPARGIFNRFLRESGPMNEAALPFPHAATLVAPLRAASEKAGSPDYMQLWSGQAAALARPMPAEQLTRKLAEEALAQCDRP